MQRTWYRQPEEDEPRTRGKGRGRGRGRGTSRGRGGGRGGGRGRKAQEPNGENYDATAPVHINTRGNHSPMHAAYPYQYHLERENLPPHWKYVLNPSHRNLHQIPVPIYTIPEYQQLPSWYSPEAQYMASAQREHFQQFVNLGSGPTQHVHSAHANSSNFQQLRFPAYTQYKNQTSTSQKAQQKSVKRSGRKDLKTDRTRVIQSEHSEELAISSLSRYANPHTPRVEQTSHPPPPHAHRLLKQTPEIVENMNIAPITSVSKTLAETAAFLNQPVITCEQVKDLNLINPAHRTHAKHTTLLPKHADISAMFSHLNQIQVTESLKNEDGFAAHPVHLLLPHEVHNLSDDHLTQAEHDNVITPQASVTLAIEPPPAHQTALNTEKFRKYPELCTPPPAHQAPISLIAPLQSKIASSLSPPPAHQASITSVDVQYPYRNIPQQIKSNTAESTDYMLGVARTFNESHQEVETFAAEQVIHEPQTYMHTKEQVVYQPNQKRLATSQVAYQSQTDVIATAETLYQPDLVVARQRVIQPQTNTMNTAVFMYDGNTLLMENTQEDIVRTTESHRYRTQIERFETIQRGYQSRAEMLQAAEDIHRAQEILLGSAERQVFQADTQARSQQACARQTGLRTKTYKQPKIKPQQSENLAIFQQFQQENTSSSIAVTPNQTLRTTRKRKISSTETDWVGRSQRYTTTQSPSNLWLQEPSVSNIAALLGSGTSAERMSLGSAVSPQMEDAATNVQSAIELNWTLQSMEANYEICRNIQRMYSNIADAAKYGNK